MGKDEENMNPLQLKLSTSRVQFDFFSQIILNFFTIKLHLSFFPK